MASLLSPQMSMLRQSSQVGLLVEFLFGERQTQLARQGFAGVAWLVIRLNALQEQQGSGQAHRTAVAVFVVLALPHQFGLHAGKRMWILRSQSAIFPYSLFLETASFNKLHERFTREPQRGAKRSAVGCMRGLGRRF